MEAVNNPVLASDQDSGCLQKVFDHAAVGMCCYGLNGKFLRVNQALCRIVDYPAEELLGMTVKQLTHPADFENDLENINQIRGGICQSYSTDKRCVTKYGRIIWVNLTVSMSREGEGHPVFFIGIIKDITDQKQSEETARQREALLRSIMDNSADMIFVKDRESRLLFMNEAGLQANGLPAEEIVGRTDLEIYGSREAHTYAEVDRRVMETGKTETVEEDFTSSSGCRSILLTTKTPSLDGDGNFVGVIGISRDITVRKRRESVMEARLRLLQRTYASSLDQVLVSTIDEAERLTGSWIGFLHFLEEDQVTLSLQAWSSNTTRQLCHAAVDKQHMPVHAAGVWVDCIRERRAVIHNDYASLPHRKGLPEGHAAIVRQLVVPVFRGDKITALLGIGNKADPYDQDDVDVVTSLADLAWDIVERKRTEDSLRHSLEEKTVLLREIHHRVKNNLQVVSSLMNLQAGRVENAEALEALNNSMNRIRAMAVLHETLYLSDSLAKPDIADYVDRIVSHLSHSYGCSSRGIEMNSTVEGVALSLSAAVPCGLIINELVINALKHAFPDNKKGHISVKLSGNADKSVVLTVADDGVGMPKDVDVDKAEKLGLTLVTALASQLQGTINVVRDHGTRFQIVFNDTAE